MISKDVHLQQNAIANVHGCEFAERRVNYKEC